MLSNSCNEHERNFITIIDTMYLFVYFPGNPLERMGVSDCEPCLNNPCKNTGQCQEINEPPGFRCQCRPGFIGSLCEGSGNGCYPDACANGRCVNLENGARFKCICAVGYTGQRCEHGKANSLVWCHVIITVMKMMMMRMMMRIRMMIHFV